MVLASLGSRTDQARPSLGKLTPRKSVLCAMPDSTVPVPLVFDRLAAKFGPPPGLGAEKMVWWSNTAEVCVA